MAKRIVVSIIVIVVAFSLGVVFTKEIIPKINTQPEVEVYTEEDSLKTLYKKTLESYSDSEGVQYALVDIDKDDTDELIVRTGLSESDYMFYFYKLNNGKMQNIGAIGGGHISLYNMNDKYILAVYAYMGYETVSNISIENNKIKYEQTSNREVELYEDYAEGDELIELIDISDLNVLNN